MDPVILLKNGMMNECGELQELPVARYSNSNRTLTSSQDTLS